ncbi:MAG: hypothetical protein Q7J73_09865 [Dehalococcoidales bacterium]|nr:hypothetical protein [Dehalococcoidales bacterium]
MKLCVAVHGQGATNLSPDLRTYPDGSRVTITALPAPGWRLDRWLGSLSGNSSVQSIILNSDKNVIANFVAFRKITIGINGQGTTNPSPDAYTYPHGTRIAVTASPAPGWRFDRWLGALSGNSPGQTVTLNSDKNVVANFVADRKLTIGINGRGTTDPSPDAYTYPHGTRVTVTALPAPGWRLDRWLRSLSGNSSVQSIILNSDKNVVANFVADRKLKETKPEPSYIANKHSKEIHRADCLWVTRMKKENKIPCSNLHEAAGMITDKGYNGCFYCLTRYDEDTLTAQKVRDNLKKDLAGLST